MIVHYFFSRVIVALLSRDFIRFISTTNSCRLWICHVTHFHCFAHTRMVFVQIHSRVPFANVNSILIIWLFFSSHILFCANFRFLFSVCSFLFWILTSIKMYIYLHGLRSICLRLSFIYFILLHACCFSHIAREREREKKRGSEWMWERSHAPMSTAGGHRRVKRQPLPGVFVVKATPVLIPFNLEINYVIISTFVDI